MTFILAAAHHPFAGKRAAPLSDNSVLALEVLIVVEVHDHPVADTLQSVRLCRVGEQHREVPAVALGVKHSNKQRSNGPVVRRERLGGMLSFYYRATA